MFEPIQGGETVRQVVQKTKLPAGFGSFPIRQ